MGNLVTTAFDEVKTASIFNSFEMPGAHMVYSSLSTAVSNLQAPPLSEKIESVYILGGASVYAVSHHCECIHSHTYMYIHVH